MYIFDHKSAKDRTAERTWLGNTFNIRSLASSDNVIGVINHRNAIRQP